MANCRQIWSHWCGTLVGERGREIKKERKRERGRISVGLSEPPCRQKVVVLDHKKEKVDKQKEIFKSKGRYSKSGVRVLIEIYLSCKEQILAKMEHDPYAVKRTDSRVWYNDKRREELKVNVLCKRYNR